VYKSDFIRLIYKLAVILPQKLKKYEIKITFILIIIFAIALFIIISVLYMMIIRIINHNIIITIVFIV